MNIAFAISGLLMAATTGLHVFGGGPEIHEPIQASALEPALRAISAVLWHAVTVILIVFTVGNAYLAKFPNPPLAIALIATQVGFAGLFIYYGMALLGTVWVLPQWTIFSTISCVMLWGLRADLKGNPVARD